MTLSSAHIFCQNDMLLGKASAEVPQGPFQESKDPRKRVEFI